MAEDLSAGDRALADALGQVIAELRGEWAKQLERIEAEARNAVLQVKIAALEILAEQHAGGACKQRKNKSRTWHLSPPAILERQWILSEVWTVVNESSTC